MKYYLLLRLTLLRRHIEDTGFHWSIGVAILLVLFVLLIIGGQHYPDFIPWIILYIAFVGITAIGNNRNHNDFLRNIFPYKIYRKIKLLENSVLFTPLLIVSIVLQQYWVATGLSTAFLVLSFISLPDKYTLPFWTPFKHYPFEFIQVYRRFLPVFLILYILVGIGLYVDNFNLALVSTGLVALLSLQTYDYRESESFIWNYCYSPASFLLFKVKRGCWQQIMLTAPLWLVVITKYPDYWLWVFVIVLLNIVFLVLSVLLKYATYPRKISVPEACIIAIACAIPLLFFGLFPYYYHKAKHNLKQYL